MSLRDAALILAQRGLFDDLDGALALVGVVLEAPSENSGPSYPAAAEPLESRDLPDEQDWPAPGNDGWSEAELEADLAAGRPGAHGGGREADDRRDDGSGSGSGEASGAGSGEGADGGTARVQPARRPGPGVIARVLDPEPEDEHRAGGGTPRSYTSVPLPGPRLREVSQETSGFRMRTLPLTLQSMIRVPLRGHEPDIPVVVERLALAEPLTDVPMQARLGQPGHIRILCELGLRTGPYAEDTELLVRVLHRLYGTERIDLRWFEYSPSLGCGRGPVWTWQRYETPGAAEATVLIAQGVPDRRSDPEAVHEFAAGLAAHGAAVGTVLFGPGPRVPRFRSYPQLLVDD